MENQVCLRSKVSRNVKEKVILRGREQRYIFEIRSA